MKVLTGVIKKVLTDEQYELIKKDLIVYNDIKMIDTIKKVELENGEFFEYLPIKLSYQDQDHSGNQKYMFDEEKNEYVKSYHTTKVIRATGKEMRILLELNEYAPVKIVYSEISRDNNNYYNVVCVQNQATGKLE